MKTLVKQKQYSVAETFRTILNNIRKQILRENIRELEIKNGSTPRLPVGLSDFEFYPTDNTQEVPDQISAMARALLNKNDPQNAEQARSKRNVL